MTEKAIKAGVTELEEPKSPNPIQKVRQILIKAPSYLTKGKIIALLTVFLILIVSYLGLNLLSQQTPENNSVSTELPVESPLNTENELPETELTKKINNFAQRVTIHEDYRKNLSIPVVDLNLDF